MGAVGTVRNARMSSGGFDCSGGRNSGRRRFLGSQPKAGSADTAKGPADEVEGVCW